MKMTEVISLRPYHVVTEIKGLKKDGTSYHKFQKEIWNWRLFYKFKLKRFIGMTIYVKTRNTLTGESFYSNFYVYPTQNGSLRLW